VFFRNSRLPGRRGLGIQGPFCQTEGPAGRLRKFPPGRRSGVAIRKSFPLNRSRRLASGPPHRWHTLRSQKTRKPFPGPRLQAARPRIPPRGCGQGLHSLLNRFGGEPSWIAGEEQTSSIRTRRDRRNSDRSGWRVIGADVVGFPVAPGVQRQQPITSTPSFFRGPVDQDLQVPKSQSPVALRSQPVQGHHEAGPLPIASNTGGV